MDILVLMNALQHFFEYEEIKKWMKSLKITKMKAVNQWLRDCNVTYVDKCRRIRHNEKNEFISYRYY